eukprot:COSAG02_NODE_36708_length_451_cov_1.221591_2_plen_68_part_01
MYTGPGFPLFGSNPATAHAVPMAVCEGEGFRPSLLAGDRRQVQSYSQFAQKCNVLQCATMCYNVLHAR